MASYALGGLFLMTPTFIGVTLIGFLIMRLAPGDPAELRAAGGLGGAGGAGVSLEKSGAVDEAGGQWGAQYGFGAARHGQTQFAVADGGLSCRDSAGHVFRDPSQLFERSGHDPGCLCAIRRPVGLGGDHGDRFYLWRGFLLSFSAG